MMHQKSFEEKSLVKTEKGNNIAGNEQGYTLQKVLSFIAILLVVTMLTALMRRFVR